MSWIERALKAERAQAYMQERIDRMQKAAEAIAIRLTNTTRALEAQDAALTTAQKCSVSHRDSFMRLRAAARLHAKFLFGVIGHAGPFDVALSPAHADALWNPIEELVSAILRIMEYAEHCQLIMDVLKVETPEAALAEVKRLVQARPYRTVEGARSRVLPGWLESRRDLFEQLYVERGLWPLPADTKPQHGDWWACGELSELDPSSFAPVKYSGCKAHNVILLRPCL